MRVGRLLVLAASSLSSGGFDSNWIEQYAQESGAAGRTCAAKEYETCRQHLKRLLEILDGRADIVYRLARVEALLGNRPAALDWLSIYSQTGLRLADVASDAAFAGLKGDSAFDAILQHLQAATQPVSNSRLSLTLPEKDLIAEDIAYDRMRGRFFVSSVRHGKILAIQNGRATQFVAEAQKDTWAVLALGVDRRRGWLWASTAAMPEYIGYGKADEGKSALLKYSLDTGVLLKRYEVHEEGKHALGDLTVSVSGDVYVSDGFGLVYWVDHRRDSLEVLIGKGVFRSPQTPALSADGRRLFVPDYTRGIGIVDLASKQVRLLAHPKELSLGGIDGLYLAGATMLAVQNGTAPPRLIRMTLDRSRTRVERWEVTECGPELGAPTHGVIVGKEFYFIANSGWDRMSDDGTLKPGLTFEPPAIRRMPFDYLSRK